MKNISKIITAGALAIVSAWPALADEVLLESFDGGTTLSGEIVEYDGRTYRLRTIFGELTVDALRVSCIGEACPAAEVALEEMRITGASELLASLMPSLLESYAADLGGAVVKQEDGSLMIVDQSKADLLKVSLASAGALDTAALRNQSATDILVSPLAIELPNAQTAEQVIALDGFVPVVSPSNGLRAIAAADLARIYAGRVSNWSQLGGNDSPVNVYVSDEGSASFRRFEELVMRPAGLSLLKNVRRVGSDEELIKALRQDPLAIGIVGMSQAGDAKILGVRGACGIQVPANDFNVKTEEYPLTHRIHLYRKGSKASTQVARFADFLATPPAQQAIAAAGYTNLAPSFQTNNEQGLRYLSSILSNGAEVTFADLQRLGATLMQSERSSIGVRFALGSSQPDARAVADIEQMASLISAADLRNKEILIVGFTDSVGSAVSNQALSERRANQVKDTLIAALPSEISSSLNIVASGFGEVSPLNCNDTDNGRRVNRRVEIWLRDVVVPSQ